jgi:hypothetical protein
MLVHDARLSLEAKLRDTAQQRAQKRMMLPTEEVEAATQVAQTTARAVAPPVQEAELGHESGTNEQDKPRLRSAELLIKAEADQELALLRRGEDPEPSAYEILTPMASPSTTSESDAAAASPDGVSAFIARVLDQLTLTAWLPAAFLTASVAVLLQFRADNSANVLEAVRALTADPVRVLVLIIPLLVIATVVTQAFSFEAIRTLEGYWHRRGLASVARTLMIRRQVHRKENITKHRLRASEKAFYAAEPRMLRNGIPFPIVNAMKAQALELSNPPLTVEERERLDRLNWRDWSDAWRVAAVDHLIKDEDAYPLDTHRVLPTRLGNLIRATEDQLENTDGDVQGFALRRYSMAPRLVQVEHDKFRDRLEMYCTLVFVSAALLIFTAVILLGSGVDLAAIAIIAGSFVALSGASYLAAIASAGGYCSALREMDRDVPKS